MHVIALYQYILITCADQEAPSVMTEVLGPTSLRITFTQPSGTLAAESYDILSTRVVGSGQELCSNRSDPDDSMTVSGVASPYDVTNLQEFSSFDITVTAIFPGSTMPTTVQNTTSTAGTICT